MAEIAVAASQQLLRPGGTEDWETRKPIIIDLYEKHDLKDVMHIMETDHHFKATENQYKKRLSSWNPKPKRIPDEVYYAMIRKKREREEIGKTSKFQLGEVDVDESKIERFQKRHKMTHDSEVPRASTPTKLICFTPPAIDRGLSHSPRARSPSLTRFDWYESFINRSVAGSPTIPEDIWSVDSLSRILRSLVQLDDSYEMQCRYDRMAWQIIASDKDCDKTCRTERMLKKIPKLPDCNQSMFHGLIRATVEYFSQDQHMCLSVFLDFFCCAMDICHTYTRIGMPSYAIDKLDFLAQHFRMPSDRIDQETADAFEISSDIKYKMEQGFCIEIPSDVIDPMDFLAQYFSMPSDRIDEETAHAFEISFDIKYKMEQAFCMASQGRDQEALAMMNNVLGFPEDIDTIHFVANFGSLCQDCRYKKLDEGADVRTDMISTLRQREEQVGLISWPTAVLIAKQLQSRRVNIDRQNQGCFHGNIYDPVLTEGMDITELETGDWETHDG